MNQIKEAMDLIRGQSLHKYRSVEFTLLSHLCRCVDALWSDLLLAGLNRDVRV